MNKFNLFIATLITTVLLSNTLSAQVYLQNTQPIDESRYKDYTGSPFYFEENQAVKMYIKGDEKVFEMQQANINLLTHSLEIYKKGQFVEIEKKMIERIEVTIDDHQMTIVPDHSTARSGFTVVLFDKSPYTLIQKISAITDQRSYNTPGKTMVKEYIRKKESYLLKVDEVEHKLSIKKKDVTKILGKESESILKKTKNKMKDPMDLVNLLEALL